MFYITKICTDGFPNGRESYTFVGDSQASLINEVFKDYEEEVDDLEDWGTPLENDRLSYDEFKDLITSDDIVLIQTPDFHIQYEPWDLENHTR